MSPGPTRVRVVGAGRAGGSFHRALGQAGWSSELVHHDHPDPAAGVDVVLVCLPDASVATVVAAWPLHPDTVVMHCAGSLGLEVLAPHPRVGSVHPLVSLPDPDTGAERLRGAWFGVAGDPVARELADALDGRVVPVPDGDRARYHATAVVASNHLVALMGQVERLAQRSGVPAEAFWSLARGALDNVAATGAAAALTGPVARGDWDTVRRHVAVLDPDELDAYLSMARQAASLAGRSLPDDLRPGPADGSGPDGHADGPGVDGS